MVGIRANRRNILIAIGIIVLAVALR